MWCFRAKKLLMQEAEGLLSKKLSGLLASHLTTCESCRKELQMLREASGILSAARPPVMEPAPDLWARVRQEIVSDGSSVPLPSSRFRYRVAWAFSTAGAAAVVAVAAWIYNSPGDVEMASVKSPAAVTVPADVLPIPVFKQPAKSSETAPKPSAEVVAPKRPADVNPVLSGKPATSVRLSPERKTRKAVPVREKIVVADAVSEVVASKTAGASISPSSTASENLMYGGDAHFDTVNGVSRYASMPPGPPDAEVEERARAVEMVYQSVDARAATLLSY